jgi:hypothetical protein
MNNGGCDGEKSLVRGGPKQETSNGFHLLQQEVMMNKKAVSVKVC